MISPLRETCGKGEYKYHKGLEKKTGFGAEMGELDEAVEIFRKFVSGVMRRCTIKGRIYESV